MRSFSCLVLLAPQVRKRPLNRRELSRSEFDVIAIDSPGRLTVQEPKTKVRIPSSLASVHCKTLSLLHSVSLLKRLLAAW